MMEPLRRRVPGTLLRSPARLLYLSTFAGSVALGFGVDAFLASDVLKLRVRQAVVALCLALHVVDLGGFARLFVQTEKPEPSQALAFEPILALHLTATRITAAACSSPP